MEDMIFLGFMDKLAADEDATYGEDKVDNAKEYPEEHGDKTKESKDKDKKKKEDSNDKKKSESDKKKYEEDEQEKIAQEYLMHGFIEKLATSYGNDEEDDILSSVIDSIKNYHTLERMSGSVLGAGAGMQLGHQMAGPPGTLAGAILGFAAGAEAAGKLMRHLESGNELYKSSSKKGMPKKKERSALPAAGVGAVGGAGLIELARKSRIGKAISKKKEHLGISRSARRFAELASGDIAREGKEIARKHKDIARRASGLARGLKKYKWGIRGRAALAGGLLAGGAKKLHDAMLKESSNKTCKHPRNDYSRIHMGPQKLEELKNKEDIKKNPDPLLSTAERHSSDFRNQAPSSDEHMKKAFYDIGAKLKNILS